MEKPVLGFVVLSGLVDDPENIFGNTEGCGELVDWEPEI